MRVVLLLAALGLAGCATAPAGVAVAPDADGLAIEGSALRIDFGRSPEGVISALTREIGPPKALPPVGCQAGIIRQLNWNGLVLSFTDQAFVGWRHGAGAAGQTCS